MSRNRFMLVVAMVLCGLGSLGKSDEALAQKGVKVGDNGTKKWAPLQEGKTYSIKLHADDRDPTYCFVPNKASHDGNSDGGAHWRTIPATKSIVEFTKAFPNASPKENGKPYSPRFKGDMQREEESPKPGTGGSTTRPIWKLKGLYDVGDIVTEPGSVEAAFAPSIEKKDIIDRIEAAFGDKEPQLDKNEILVKVEAALNKLKLKGQLPKNFDIDKKAQAAYDDVKLAILREIDAKTSQLNDAIEKSINTAATNVKECLDQMTPHVRFTGNYRYLAGQREPGDPGWIGIQADAFPGTSFSARGGAAFNASVSIDGKVFGIGPGISIDVGGSIFVEAEMTFGTNGTSDALRPQHPVTQVSTLPVVDYRFSADFEMHAGLGVSGGLTIPASSTLDRAYATIEAGKDKQLKDNE